MMRRKKLVEESSPRLQHMMKLLKMMCHLLQWGWTVKIYLKVGGDSVSHHRLMGMLAAYFADWNLAMEYVC
jgi:hypothetical protein